MESRVGTHARRDSREAAEGLAKARVGVRWKNPTLWICGSFLIICGRPPSSSCIKPSFSHNLIVLISQK